jgi:hypothetical protein
MYQSEKMYAEHTYFGSLYALVLDKSNAALTEDDSKTRGFRPDIKAYAKGRITAEQIFTRYGSHYANAVCYGVRGRARHAFTKERMSTLLQSCTKIGSGLESKVSGGKLVKVGIGGGYSQSDAQDDSKEISQSSDTEDQDYKCIGSSACSIGGQPGEGSTTSVPVLLDLRPLPELLRPPFFTDYHIAVTARENLEGELKKYLSGSPPNSVDVFHYLSICFNIPMASSSDTSLLTDNTQLEYVQGMSFNLGPASNTKRKEGSDIADYATGKEWIAIYFRYSGHGDDPRALLSLNFPGGAGWHVGRGGGNIFAPDPDQTGFRMDLELDLGDERLFLKEGLALVAESPSIRVSLTRDYTRGVDVKLKFPLVIKKLTCRHRVDLTATPDSKGQAMQIHRTSPCAAGGSDYFDIDHLRRIQDG